MIRTRARRILSRRRRQEFVGYKLWVSMVCVVVVVQCVQIYWMDVQLFEKHDVKSDKIVSPRKAEEPIELKHSKIVQYI